MVGPGDRPSSRYQMLSSLNKEAASSKKNLFVREFSLEEANKLTDNQINPSHQ